MVQIVKQTWQDRYNKYMSLEKEQLATMLAEQEKWIFPQGCAELAQDQPIDTRFYTTSTYNIK